MIVRYGVVDNCNPVKYTRVNTVIKHTEMSRHGRSISQYLYDIERPWRLIPVCLVTPSNCKIFLLVR